MAWNDFDMGRGEMLFEMMKCAGFLVISLSCGYLVVIVCSFSEEELGGTFIGKRDGGGCCISQLSNSNT